MKRKLTIFTFLLTVLAGNVDAQDAALPTVSEGDAKDFPTVRFDFSVFPLEPADWNGILYAPNGDPLDGVEPLRFNPHERSLGFAYSGPTPFRVFRRSVTPEGEETYQIVGQVDLKPTKEDLILFFSKSPNANDKGPYRIQFMVDSNYSFPENSIVFFNSTGATFYGILGEQRITLEPGSSKPTDVSDYFDSPAPIALVIRDGDKIHKVHVNKIRFSPERRTLMILRPPASQSSMRIRTQRLTEYLGGSSSSEDPGA